MRLSHMTFPAPRPCLHLIKKRRLSMKQDRVVKTGIRCKDL